MIIVEPCLRSRQPRGCRGRYQSYQSCGCAALRLVCNTYDAFLSQRFVFWTFACTASIFPRGRPSHKIFCSTRAQLHRQTTVDLNDSTGNIRGCIRKEKSGDGRNLLYRAEATEGNQVQCSTALLG